MNVQPTSAIAFRQAEQSGALNGKRYEVARAFTEYGPGTSAEVLKAARLDKNRNLMRARVTELADIGWLKQVGARKCKVTGRKAIVWAFEKTEPRKTAENKTSYTKAELLDYLRGTVKIADSFYGQLVATGFVDKGGELRALIDEAAAAAGIKAE